MRALLLSNSTNSGESYLGYAKKYIDEFMGNKLLNAVFVPYAAVTFSYDEYEEKVNEGLRHTIHNITGIHRFTDPIQAIQNAEAIIVGGGNTWKLTKLLYDNNLMSVIRKKVVGGVPYIGWSAGSNVACPTLSTTNDMPVVEPSSFNTIGLIPFQINPHYTDEIIPNHGGESREIRIAEYIAENQDVYVVGLREGTMLHLENSELRLIGKNTAKLFKYGTETIEISSKDNLNFLIEK